jgi:hypothetical protein
MTAPRFASFARCLLAAAALFPAALAGCGSDVTGEDQCTVDGVDYDVGESFPAPDGCNTCTCQEGGQAACTLMGCIDGCEVDGVMHAPGDTFPAGCNTCTCMEDGNVACTDMACTCEYQGQTYSQGESFPAGDGCNTCTCDPEGSGEAMCTLMACPGCVYAGEGHVPGETFPALDGCNTCTCQPDGTVSCTEIACPCDPAAEWWREYMSQDAQECLLLDFGCPPNTVRFDNQCGCGCEQDATCPQYLDCMPPAQCTPEQIQEFTDQCPYSQVVF